MKLLSFKLFLGSLLFFSLVRPIFAQEQYFFSEEFNQERQPGILDPQKWIVYPNKPAQPTGTGCLIDTVTETGGILLLKQCAGVPQFPYVISKENPFPDGDFTAETRLQFTTGGAISTGIHFADTAPANGTGFTSLFTISFEEDDFTGLAMRIEYQDQSVFTTRTNSNYHLFQVVRENDIYKLYFDNQLVFTSPSTDKKVKVIYMGSPEIVSTPGYPWAWPRIDYIHVINNGPISSTHQPFLELPWDYGANNMTFTESATAINSYFDHAYPLLSTNLQEPSQQSLDVTNYEKLTSAQLPYSSHDGYDYGSLAKTKLGTPELAAADGEATFMSQNTCWACGNAILIDHKNGFQTRYYHLQPDGLIVNQEGVKVNVSKGQQIGKVGYTGNVIPLGKPEGAHIHFMVIQDKNNDGSFEDNIPDGLVDPFGWQSDAPDPWETYTFNYKGQQRTGNKSYYLFTKKLDNLNASLTSNQAVFNVGKTTIAFPEGSTNENVTILTTAQPTYVGPLLNSLGSIINITAKNSAGQNITTFLKNFALTIDFSQFDLKRYNPDTLSIFSSQDGQNWTKENSTIDLQNKTATTSINHLTYFALMAERKDILPPTTTPALNGTKGKDNNFRSDVLLNLNTVDNSNGLGVEFTAWGYENQSWQTYSSPLSFTQEGNYKIFFYSQDKDDNIEEIKSVEFSIDKTPPEAKIEVDKSLWDLKITPLASDSAITKSPGKKLNEFTYFLNDLAGNTLTLETYQLNTTPIDYLKIYSLKYNDNPKILLTDNTLDTNYLFYTPKNKPEIKIINQNFVFKDKTTYIILADAIKNKTLLTILENKPSLPEGKKIRTEEKPGIVLLNLKTNQGKLEYSY